MKKKLLIIVAIFIVIGLSFKIFFPSVSDIIRKVVNKYGSEVTGTDVSISSVDFSLKNGNVTINGFAIGNAKGYSEDNLFKLGKISATVDLKSITKDVIIVKDITILEPDVTYELKGIKSNVNRVKENINSYMASKKSDTKEVVKETEVKSDKPAKKVIIENVLIKGGKVNLASDMVGKLTLPMPAIKLKDIGKSTGGATPAMALSKVFNSILNGATSVVKEAGVGVGAIANGAKDAVSGAAGEVGGAVKEIGGSLKGLFD